MKKTLIYGIPALALLFVLSIWQVVAAQSALVGTNWVLSSLDSQLPLPGTTITLQFNDDETASGSDGCNRYSTGFTTEGSFISFSEAGAVGMMACPEAVLAQGTAYMEALASATDFEVRRNQLTLLDEDDNVLATFVSALQELEGTQWMVTGYNSGNAVTSLLEGSEITAEFDEVGGLSGNAGCNEYFGTFLTTNDTILIGRIGSTMRLCPEPAGLMEQEAAYLEALQSATRFTIDGGTLEMRNSAGEIAVLMVRVFNVTVPEPEPGVPTGRVTAPHGVNIRSGPGTNFPSFGVAPNGTEGEIIGRSADGRWWVVAAPSVPGGSAWVSADFVAATDADDVPIIASPPPPIVIPAPTPLPTPTRVPAPTATPSPQLSFSADRTTITQGECATLRWSVENVQAVWVYQQGRNYWNYPRVGQGSEQVCPPTTTTYEMRVLQRNGAVVTRQVTVNVTPAAAQNPLAGTAWNVANFNNGQNAVVTPLTGTNLTVRFEGDRVSGNGGCNSFTAGYSVSGSSIWIAQPAGGMMLCSDVSGQMEQESQFFFALQSSTSFQIDGNRLTLRGWDGSMTVVLNRQ